MFRSESLTAHVMADVYVDGSDQQIGDDDWIADIAARGWIALTKDSNIARHHKQALTSSGLRVFAIDSANLTGEEMADRYRRHLPRILKLARQPGPYVRVIHKNDIELRWRPR